MLINMGLITILCTGGVRITAAGNDEERLVSKAAETPSHNLNYDQNGDGCVDRTDAFIHMSGWDGNVSALLGLIGEWHDEIPTFTPTATLTVTLTPTPTRTDTSPPTMTPTETPVLQDLTFAAVVNRGIPDDNPGGLVSDIVVPNDLYIHDLKVGVWITHEFVDDLAVDLRGPDGTQIRLANEDMWEIRGVFGTDYIPSGPGDLADFRGKKAKGTWRLTVRDLWDEYTGTLDRWELRILLNSQPPVPPTPTPTPEGESVCIATYFPLGNFSWKYSTSSVGTVEAQMLGGARICGKNMYRLTTTAQSQTVGEAHFNQEGENLKNYGSQDLSICSSPILYGGCDIRNGSHYNSDFEVSGAEFHLALDWSFVGRRTVPAGSFDDCIELAVSIDAWDPGSGEALSGTWDVWTLAPGVGRIEFAILDQFFDIYETGTLTESSILKGEATPYPSQAMSIQTLPDGCFLAGPEQIIEAILHRFGK
jgi:subtilisin-like proprotein convertase family protein